MSRSKSKSKPKTRHKAHSRPRGFFEGNPQGFGFVKTAEGEFFIPAKFTYSAFDGDLVEISPLPARSSSQSTHGRRAGRPLSDDSRRREARVVRVVERAHDVLVGRYEVAGPFGVVIPDDRRIKHDIFTLRRDSPDVEDGAIVRVRILEYPTRKTSATGVVEEVLGMDGDSALSVERVIAKHDLETKFSEASLEEARAASTDIPAALASGYRDIRDRYIFTIDPADAKDFDDAISIDLIQEAQSSSHANSKSPKAVFLDGMPPAKFEFGCGRVWRLGVHIADVSHYVPWNSSLDLEARARATSVYLVDRVIPMLPEELSNNLCSLRPDEDRLCMSADLYVDDDANLIAYDLYPAIMRSRRRLSYDDALEILKGMTDDDADNDVASRDVANKDIVERLFRAHKLAQARQRHRETLGGIEFSTKEAKVRLDGEGAPLSIEVREKNDATELIEEAMIFTNEVVAAHLEARSWPCAFRIHEQPAPDSLAALIPVLQEFSWFKKGHSERLVTGDPHTIQEILDICAGRPEEELVTMLFLRAMMRAVYSPKNLGHYGLGLSSYCHFTSPIRRYPDLIVHRMLRANLTRRPELFDQEVSSLKWLCEHSSEMERRAEAAAFDSQKAKIVEYMESFVGQRFNAIISGVANYGLYVRLDNCAEGLVPVRSLGDEYFIFDSVRSTLRGSDSDVVYRLGQPIEVELVCADVDESRLDFAIIQKADSANRRV